MGVQKTRGDGDVNVVQFRIVRGAEAMSTDGRIGVVEQIVVDRTSGQLLSLVIRGDESNTEFEMPASHVRSAMGDRVYLDVSRADLMDHPEMTSPYNPARYVPVYQGDALPPGVASRVAAEQEKPIITDVEENAAKLVAPGVTAASQGEATRRTDERAAASHRPASEGSPMAGATRIPAVRAALDADNTPTLKLSRAGGPIGVPAGWNEAAGAEERPVPPPEASEAHSSLWMTAPSRQLANLRDHAPDLLLNMARSPEAWILASSLGAGVIGGILMWRRGTLASATPNSNPATGTAGDVPDRARSRAADAAGDFVAGARRKTGDARQRMRKSAKRAARRGRWFRRGLLLGSAGAVLFAPRRGEEMRTQISSAWKRLRPRNV
ncbi:MAG TPA: hypothetical protein VKQ30_04380 [Ktedonobacterales bacterium]|nr:hypothetical protein [Ktedonobacterales bacterium]